MPIPAKTQKKPKMQKNNNLLKLKRKINTKMSTKGGPVFIFIFSGRAPRPLAPRQLRHCTRAISHVTLYSKIPGAHAIEAN